MTASTKPTIAIIGAGVVGVCTALQLASLPGTPVDVVVVEILDGPFGAASSHNTGSITTTPVQSGGYGQNVLRQDRINELGTYSFQQWMAFFAGNPDIARRSGFRVARPWAIHSVESTAEGERREEAPTPWTKLPQGYVAIENPHEYGRFNPKALGECLVEQCKAAGVTFHFGARVAQIQLTPDGTVAGIDIHLKDSTTSHIPHCDVVFAAGPWSQAEADRLLPGNSTRVPFDTSSANYLIVKAPAPIPPETCCNVSWYIPGRDVPLEISPRNDGTIWVSGINDLESPLPASGETLPPEGSTREKFVELAKQVLNFDVDDFETAEWGRVFRPLVKGECPVITRVPVERLLSAKSETSQKDDTPGGKVYLATGHGRHGMKLGMGTGKLLAQLITGQELGLSLQAFGLREE